MFKYNSFWHSWSQLGNWDYFRVTLASMVLILATPFSPALMIPAVVLPFTVGGVMTLLTQLSNFFYRRQNQQLIQIKEHSPDAILKNQIDLYLDRRVVCPSELMKGEKLNLPPETEEMTSAVAASPLILQKEDNFSMEIAGDGSNRNITTIAFSDDNQLFIKTVVARDGLLEIAGREMAEIFGFGGLIPSSTITGVTALAEQVDQDFINSTGLVLSRQKIQQEINKHNEDPAKAHIPIKNSVGVQNAVAKFVLNLKTAFYRARIQRKEQFDLLYIQKLVTNAMDGQQLFAALFNEPRSLPAQFLAGLNDLTSEEKGAIEEEERAQENFCLAQQNVQLAEDELLVEAPLDEEPLREENLRQANNAALRAEEAAQQAQENAQPVRRRALENILKKINIHSFQKNFLLQLLLGSEDGNPGNTLFTHSPDDSIALHSIDHEKIMPEDNYNVTKKVPIGNDPAAPVVELDIKDMFPFRIWLAGLPHANVPFTKEIIKDTLSSLNPQRILAYHWQKKLFSSSAVGAQLDRVLFIKEVFEEEIKKAQITLSPRELFLKFVNHHPSYIFLKEILQCSDLSTFVLLGKIPTGADMSLSRHPLNWLPMWALNEELRRNSAEGRAPFSERSFKSSHAHHVVFFNISCTQRDLEKTNTSLDILDETNNYLGL